MLKSSHSDFDLEMRGQSTKMSFSSSNPLYWDVFIFSTPCACKNAALPLLLPIFSLSFFHSLLDHWLLISSINALCHQSLSKSKQTVSVILSLTTKPVTTTNLKRTNNHYLTIEYDRGRKVSGRTNECSILSIETHIVFRLPQTHGMLWRKRQLARKNIAI